MLLESSRSSLASEVVVFVFSFVLFCFPDVIFLFSFTLLNYTKESLR